MRQQIYLLLIILTTNTNVYSQDSSFINKNISSFYGLNSRELELWRKDINGCKSFRSKLVDTLPKNKLIIGMPKKLFFILFGKPDITNSQDEIYTYYSGCTCDKEGKHLKNTEFIMMIFLFVDGKLFSLSYSMT